MSHDPLEPNAIATVGRTLGFAVEVSIAEALSRFGRLFLQWNERINLASLRTPAELTERHFADAFAAAQMIRPGEHVADVGSGGGLPAIPMAILLETCRFDLFEPIRKKVAFLRTAVRELGLAPRVNVHASSVVQPVAPPFAQGFDVAMSRATFAPPTWLALGRELAREGGRVLVFTAGQSGEDLPDALQTMSYGENRTLLAVAAHLAASQR
jgi:16S rRNA (guanine527-N7)-methyltransferase